MIRTALVALALVTLSPAVQAGSSRDTDRSGSYSSDRSSDTPVQGMTPWSNGNPNSTTYYDATTGRATGYDISRPGSTIQRGPEGQFEGIISRPSRQHGGNGR